MITMKNLQVEDIKDGEDGKYYLRPNGYNQRHQKCGDTDYRYISDGYNEQYTIDFSDTIKLDKSRTIENEGTKYNYKGVKIKNDSKPTQLTPKIPNIYDNQPMH